MNLYVNRLLSEITLGSTDVTRLQSFRLLQDDVSANLQSVDDFQFFCKLLLHIQMDVNNFCIPVRLLLLQFDCAGNTLRPTSTGSTKAIHPLIRISTVRS